MASSMVCHNWAIYHIHMFRLYHINFSLELGCQALNCNIITKCSCAAIPVLIDC